MACVAWVVVDGRSIKQSIRADDINQHRANSPLPVPTNGLTIEQSFYSRWDGLREVELLIAGDGAAGSENGRLQFQLLDDNGIIVAATTAATISMKPDQSYAFRFGPLPDSAGRTFTLRISGNDENPVSVWGYNMDAYSSSEVVLRPGALSPDVPSTFAKDLRFITWYELTWQDALDGGGNGRCANWLASLRLTHFPATARNSHAAHQTKLGAQLGSTGLAGGGTGAGHLRLGACLAMGFAGKRPFLRLAALGLGDWRLDTCHLSLLATPFILHSFLHLRTGLHPSTGNISPLLALLLIAFSVRLLAVRDLAFPPWVDSSRHALITAVMVEQGQTPSNYAPYLPVDRFPYHFGYHTLSASMQLMTGWDLAQMLLDFRPTAQHPGGADGVCGRLVLHAPPPRRTAGGTAGGAALLLPCLLCFLGTDDAVNGRFAHARSVGINVAVSSRRKAVAANVVASRHFGSGTVPGAFSRICLFFTRLRRLYG